LIKFRENILKEQVILFDLDGTLIDSTEAILKSFDESFKDLGFPAQSHKKIKSLIGHPLDHMYEMLGVDREAVWDYVDCYKTHYRRYSKNMTKLLPNAATSVKMANEIARVGIVTTKTARYSKELLEHMGIMDYFEVLIGREDVTNPKPHPEPIEKALNSLNATKSSTVWMIGDTCLDILSAKAAGVESIAVLSGYGEESELKKCSKILLFDTLEAIEFIKNSNKADVKRD
jgi:phosphoglycolate phosphatase